MINDIWAPDPGLLAVRQTFSPRINLLELYYDRGGNPGDNKNENIRIARVVDFVAVSAFSNWFEVPTLQFQVLDDGVSIRRYLAADYVLEAFCKLWKEKETLPTWLEKVSRMPGLKESELQRLRRIAFEVIVQSSLMSKVLFGRPTANDPVQESIELTGS